MIRTTLLSAALITVPTTTVAGQQSPTVQGSWEAELNEWDNEERVQLNLRIRFDGDRSNWGNSHEVEELPELAAALRRGGRTDVAFSMVREAGRIDFTGTTDGDEADGEFNWTGSASFAASMERLGYDDLTRRQQFAMTVQDITIAFAQAMQDRGYDVSSEDLVRFGIFDVTPEFVDDLAALGHERVESDMLVQLRIHGVTPGYISDMAGAGYQSELEDYVRFRIHGVDAELAGAMANTFGTAIDADDVVRLQIHGVDAAYVEGLENAASFELELEDAVRMKIHGVSPSWVSEIAAAGYPDVSADDLVRFRIHGIDAGFVEELASEGHEDLTADELVRARITGRVRRQP